MQEQKETRTKFTPHKWKILYMKGNVYLIYDLKTDTNLYRVLALEGEKGAIVFEKLYETKEEAMVDFNHFAESETAELVDFRKNRELKIQAAQEKEEAEREKRKD